MPKKNIKYVVTIGTVTREFSTYAEMDWYFRNNWSMYTYWEIHKFENGVQVY